MPHNKLYPDGAIEGLLLTDFVSAATRAVLEERSVEKDVAPAYLDAISFRVLILLCRRLLALGDEPLATRIAAAIDARLAGDQSNGWRYQQMPGDRDTYKLALRVIDEMARKNHHAIFADLAEKQQLTLMQQLQKGEAGGDWSGVSAARFFEELLCEVTELFYSYPYAQNEIGFVGMADAHGWKMIGLKEQETPEPPEPSPLPHP